MHVKTPLIHVLCCGMHLADGARAYSADFEARFTGSDHPDVMRVAYCKGFVLYIATVRKGTSGNEQVNVFLYFVDRASCNDSW